MNFLLLTALILAPFVGEHLWRRLSGDDRAAALTPSVIRIVARDGVAKASAIITAIKLYVALCGHHGYRKLGNTGVPGSGVGLWGHRVAGSSRSGHAAGQD